MKITTFFRWYDLWIGAYWSTKQRSLFVCPVPMFGVRIDFHWTRRVTRRYDYLDHVWQEPGHDL